MFSMPIPNAKKRVQSISRLQMLVSFAALAMLLSPISAYGMDPEIIEPQTIPPKVQTKFQAILEMALEEDGKSLCILGHCYRYGKAYRDCALTSSTITIVNHKIANQYYKRAVAAGDTSAAVELANYYYYRGKDGDRELFEFWNNKKFPKKAGVPEPLIIPEKTRVPENKGICHII